MKNSIRKAIVPISVIIMVALWEIISLVVGSEHILPDPYTTIISAIDIICQKDFLHIVLSTVTRGLIGFVIAILSGIGLGIIAGIYDGFREFMKPWITVMRSTPVIAFVLLAIIWFSESTAIVLSIITMFPIIFTNIIEGIHNVDGRLLQMAEVYKVRKSRVLNDIYIPYIIPYMTSGVSTAIGIGMRVIIVGEVMSQPRYGIGSSMQLAQIHMNVDRLIAWTIIAVLLGYIFERLFRFVENVAVKRYK